MDSVSPSSEDVEQQQHSALSASLSAGGGSDVDILVVPAPAVVAVLSSAALQAAINRTPSTLHFAALCQAML